MLDWVATVGTLNVIYIIDCYYWLLLLFCASLSLSITNVVAGLDFEVLIMIARHLSAIIIMKLEKKKCFITRSRNYTTYLGPHSEVADRRKLTWGSAFIGIGIGGGLGFCGLTLFGKFKT